MNYRALAQQLLDRVTRSHTPAVLAGEMAHLGPEAFGEALRLRWLAPDAESGGLLIANSAQVLEQLREVAAGNYRTLDGVELSEADDEQPKVGDEVITTVNGQAVKARVKSVNPDGTLVLDYPNAAPSVKPIKPNEVRVTSRPAPKVDQGSKGLASQPVVPTKPSTTLVR